MQKMLSAHLEPELHALVAIAEKAAHAAAKRCCDQAERLHATAMARKYSGQEVDSDEEDGGRI